MSAKHIYMRWERYGWQLLGKITDAITSKTPQLLKKFNFRIVWCDSTKGPATANYSHGPDAQFDSWVLLKPSES